MKRHTTRSQGKRWSCCHDKGNVNAIADSRHTTEHLRSDIRNRDCVGSGHAASSRGRHCRKSDGTAHGGHLLEAHVRPTLEVIITESAGELRKSYDPLSKLDL